MAQAGVADTSEAHTMSFFTEGPEVIAMVNELPESPAPQKIAERAGAILNKYMEAPHLLDASLERLVVPLITVARGLNNSAELDSAVFQLLYILTKVRGYKTVMRLFSNEAIDFHPTVNRLIKMKPSDPKTWQQRYILLLWLSLVCMLPFDMAVLDSGGDESSVQKIMKLCYSYLTNADKSRDAAALVVARLVTRPDLHQSLLPEFIAWSVTKLNETDPRSVSGMFELTGVLSSLAAVFKLGKREELLPHTARVSEALENIGKQAKAVHGSGKEDLPNALLRKLRAKLSQRLGLTFLKPRVAPWRYQRGKRTLLSIGTSAASQEGVKNQTIDHDDDDDIDDDVADEVAQVINQMLNALQDSDTIVRWSAAKGIGRITGRLPLDFADDVVGSVLGLCSPRESHAAWHGACLALAELGRRGLLLPERLGGDDGVVPVLLRALSYDELRGAASVGAHVRDAACYVAWAFARAYDPDVIKVHIEEIAKALLVATVFDREINVRRAASAAFQENVGRQGTLPNGIDIVTEADYFAVGNRNRAFLDISHYIAQFQQYTPAFIDHLVEVKLVHWDRSIRELAAKALNRLTSRSTERISECLQKVIFPQCTSADLNTRHGNIVAAGEVTIALSKESAISDALTQSNAQRCSELLLELDKLEAFRGSGGEMIRVAVLGMISNVAACESNLELSSMEVLQQQVAENLGYEKAEVQNAALDAFKALCRSSNFYAKPSSLGWDMGCIVVETMVKRLDMGDTTPRLKKGYVGALGKLSDESAHHHLHLVTQSLVKACQLSAAPDELTTDTRAIAITSLSSMLSKNLRAKTISTHEDKLLREVVEAIFDGMADYTIDSRGDIGSRVREASMHGLESILASISHADIQSGKAEFIESTCTKLVQCLSQQVMEKIDRTRSVAGNILCALCKNEKLAAAIPHRSELLKIGFGEKVDWNSASETFSRTVSLLTLETYRYCALSGLVISVGGLTESLVKQSSSSLLEFLEDETNDLEVFGNELLAVFRNNQLNSRVTIPILKTLDLLFCHGTLADLCIDGHGFAKSLGDLCKAEIAKCTDVQKIRCAVDVFCGLMVAPDPARKTCLGCLMMSLCHKYPRVRKFTAEKLYTEFDSAVDYEWFSEEVVNQVQEILKNTLWDADVSHAREERNKICDLLGLPKPKLKAKQNKPQVAAVAGDDLDSYKDLVERTGY